jgi:hypothetical protein
MRSRFRESRPLDPTVPDGKPPDVAVPVGGSIPVGGSVSCCAGPLARWSLTATGRSARLDCRERIPPPRCSSLVPPYIVQSAPAATAGVGGDFLQALRKKTSEPTISSDMLRRIFVSSLEKPRFTFLASTWPNRARGQRGMQVIRHRYELGVAGELLLAPDSSELRSHFCGQST